MLGMFFNCKQLKEINLENFDTSSLSNMNQMFEFCENLEYLNFKNYNENYNISFTNTLDGIRNNTIICLDENNENKNIWQLKSVFASKTCHVIYCGDDWRSHIKKIVSETGICADNCSDYRYENNNYCFSTCPEGAEFCSPDPESIETTNVNTTIINEGNNIYTTNIFTNNISEEIYQININSFNTYAESSIISINPKTSIIPSIKENSNEEKKITYDTISLDYEDFDNAISFLEFKNIISHNISYFVNSSFVINGSDFLALIYFSDDADSKKQLNMGISPFDLSVCFQDLKNFYNISKLLLFKIFKRINKKIQKWNWGLGPNTLN